MSGSNGSYWSEFLFLVIFLAIYYRFMAPTFKITDSYEKYKKNSIMKSLTMIVFIMVVEIIFAFMYFASICNNYGGGVWYIFLIWFTIFVGTKFFLISNPGCISYFSDTIGFWAIGSKANKLMSEILVKPGEEGKLSKQNATILSEVIGQYSLLINKMVPSNFEKMWVSLKEIADPADYNDENKQNLLNLVIIRENIGEYVWLVWAGVLCISGISVYIASYSCELTPQQVQENTNAYNEQTEEDNNAPQENYLIY